jgi:hypothetical protein
MQKGKKKKENFSKKKKPFRDEFVWLLVLGFWMAGIFIASSVPGTGENYWDFRTFLERKGAHVLEYFVLAYLFWKVTAFQEISFSRKMIISVFAALLYAFSDEIHQLFVFGREGQLLDVGIDFAGILLFILLVEVKTGIFPKEKTRR